MDLSEVFADNLVKVKYKSLPSQVVEVTRKSVLDTLGIILGASGTTPGVKGVVDLTQEIHGSQESTILGFGCKAPSWLAAWANGSMAHCLDYDDFHHDALLHPSSSVVPAALAMAERVGGVSGKDFITAVAIGNDLSCRLGLAVPWAREWHLSTVLGIFGATAAVSKVLGLEANRVVDAFGIAFSHASGTMELRFGVGSDLGGMYPGFPAHDAVLAALMAQKGVIGLKSSFEGRAGLFNVFFRGKYDRDLLVADLGKKFEGANVGFKAWPACAVSHVYIDATLQIMSQNHISPTDIKTVTPYVGDLAQALCEPLESRRRPKTVIDAKYSIPFILATVATKVNVVISDFSPEGLKNKDVLSFAKKVQPLVDKRFDVSSGMPPGIVEIETNGGKKYQKQVDVPYGHPRNPLAMSDLIAKFKDCASHSAKAIPAKKLERLTGALTQLEDVSDMRDVTLMFKTR